MSFDVSDANSGETGDTNDRGDEPDAVLERRATTFSGTVAVLVAALAGLALGAAGGSLWSVAATIGGGVLAALGVRAVQSGTNARRAVGSVGVVAGVSVFAIVATLGGGPVALLVGAGVGAAATNAVVSFDERVERPAVRAVWRSATVLSVGAVLAVCLYADVFAKTFGVVGGNLVAAAESSALALLVVLQLELLAVAELVHWAVPVLDGWLPENRDLRAAVLDRFDRRLWDVPRAYWAVLGLQIVLALSEWGPAWFRGFLDSLSVLGDALELVLFSGVVHLPLTALVVGLVGVLLARGLQALFVGWAGSDPPRSVAHAAGGLVTLAVAALLALAPTEALAAAAGTGWTETVASVGLTAALAGGVAATLFAVAFSQRVLAVAVAPWVGTESASGFAVAGGSLMVASLVVADGGGSALAAFVGVAAALAVHDLGSNAVELGARIGRDAETRAGEAAHAVGGLLVGAGGVLIATLTAFGMGSLSFSPPAWRARLAVALLLVAVLCFAVLFERE
ncbi:hypothetical protein M0R89_19995 (plasmid) [Halorussus limi]|uniref:Uncharacterized protein n=1 Tax=Halorussus limi TaxID=2938695 RepID=A0A8U0I0K5_9EURY|nr:hypothetical protein [Halorussus limi]UPV76446.1 hypothetical protein M0R89_19995 [Halorussus limi]